MLRYVTLTKVGLCRYSNPHIVFNILNTRDIEYHIKKIAKGLQDPDSKS